MENCIVVIPVHSESPSANELLSFKRCFTILSAYTIKVIAPKNIKLDQYKQVIPDFEMIYVKYKWLSSIEHYNKFKRSLSFYRLFDDFDYLLTYELDAYVFSDELSYWCEQKPDYIGAPWFEGFSNPVSDQFIGVGNSGFSLRNISKCISILKRIDALKILVKLFGVSFVQSFIKYLVKNSFFDFHKKLKDNFNPSELINLSSVNEDYFWSAIVPIHFADFIPSNISEAIRFSFEVNPSLLFKLNDNKLPFGCHAWNRYEPEFWNRFIGS